MHVIDCGWKNMSKDGSWTLGPTLISPMTSTTSLHLESIVVVIPLTQIILFILLHAFYFLENQNRLAIWCDNYATKIAHLHIEHKQL